MMCKFMWTAYGREKEKLLNQLILYKLAEIRNPSWINLTFLYTWETGADNLQCLAKKQWLIHGSNTSSTVLTYP